MGNEGVYCAGNTDCGNSRTVLGPRGRSGDFRWRIEPSRRVLVLKKSLFHSFFLGCNFHLVDCRF